MRATDSFRGELPSNRNPLDNSSYLLNVPRHVEQTHEQLTVAIGAASQPLCNYYTNDARRSQ